MISTKKIEIFYFSITGTIDNIYLTIDGNSSQLYEIAECTAQEKDFVIQPMIKGKNVRAVYII